MKKMVIILFLLLLLAGCGSSESVPYYSSSSTSPVRSENIEIWDEAESEYQEGADFWDSVDSNIQPLDKSCVYWVPKGKSYHSTKDCVALLHSDTILHGTLAEAFDEGKSDPCSKCVGD